MQFIQPEPELASNHTESVLVISPASIEVLLSVVTILYHQPPTAEALLTEYSERLR